MTVGQGDPAKTVEAGLAQQALALAHVARSPSALEPGPQPTPRALDERLALMVLAQLAPQWR